jgi:hypothetical protein
VDVFRTPHKTGSRGFRVISQDWVSCLGRSLLSWKSCKHSRMGMDSALKQLALLTEKGRGPWVKVTGTKSLKSQWRDLQWVPAWGMFFVFVLFSFWWCWGLNSRALYFCAY